MRPVMLVCTVGALSFGALACASSLHVETIAAPELSITRGTTFRLLAVPQPRDGYVQRGAYDPMVNNSIANRALRATIAKGFSDRGYTLNEQAPDFEIAVYATARERLDVMAWDYGYPFWPRSRWGWRMQRFVTEYTEGTVIVDVVRASDRDLLWRGSASARLSDDPSKDVKALQKVAATIVKKFPRAPQQSVVTLR